MSICGFILLCDLCGKNDLMELEFDKEMDAILRKTWDNRGVLVGDNPPEPKKHLDADTIAAFAENAVPPKAKLLYMEHFADCDRCRRTLTNLILLNSEAAETAASHTISAPVAEVAVPWYVKIFRTPNLALAMGALVVAFSGILGYLVLQNRNNSGGATVSQVTDQERAKGDPYYGGGSAVNMAGANATAANSANTSIANAPAMPSAMANTLANPTTKDVGRANSALDSVQPESERPFATGGAAAEPAKPATGAPAPPVGQPVASRDERKAGEDKLKDDAKESNLAKTENDRDRMDREVSAAKKIGPTGPNRASGPRNAQQNIQQQEMNTQSVAGMIAPTKTAGGKAFENRNGAWYDTAYHGQSTTNVRRGTDKYKKLDGGLRSIADSIGGTVVLVWKEKAYRIQ